jgi:hypothetical protein
MSLEKHINKERVYMIRSNHGNYATNSWSVNYVKIKLVSIVLWDVPLSKLLCTSWLHRRLMDGVLHARKVPCEMYSFSSIHVKARTALNMFRTLQF